MAYSVEITAPTAVSIGTPTIVMNMDVSTAAIIARTIHRERDRGASISKTKSGMDRSVFTNDSRPDDCCHYRSGDRGCYRV